MAGVDFCFIGKLHKLLDALHKLMVIAAGQIRTANAEIKEGIAAKQNTVAQKTDAARTVPRRVHYRKVKVPNVYFITIFKQSVRWWRWWIGNAQKKPP